MRSARWQFPIGAASLEIGDEQGNDVGRGQPCFGCVADTTGD